MTFIKFPRLLLLGAARFIVLLLFLFLVSMRLARSPEHQMAHMEYENADEVLRMALRRNYEINPFGVICGNTVYNLAEGFQLVIPEGLELELVNMTKGDPFSLSLSDDEKAICFELTSYDVGTLPEAYTTKDYHESVAKVFGGKGLDSTSAGQHDLGELFSSSCLDCPRDGINASWTSIQSDITLINLALAYPASSQDAASSASRAVLSAIQPLDVAAAYRCLEELILAEAAKLAIDGPNTEIIELGSGRLLINRERSYVLLLPAEASVIFQEDEEPKVQLISGCSVRVYTTSERDMEGRILDLHKMIGDVLVGGYQETERINLEPFDYAISSCSKCIGKGCTVIWATRQTPKRAYSVLMTSANLTEEGARQRIELLLHSVIPLE